MRIGNEGITRKAKACGGMHRQTKTHWTNMNTNLYCDNVDRFKLREQIERLINREL